jgi:hypothetical protein
MSSAKADAAPRVLQLNRCRFRIVLHAKKGIIALRKSILFLLVDPDCVVGQRRAEEVSPGRIARVAESAGIDKKVLASDT